VTSWRATLASGVRENASTPFSHRIRPGGMLAKQLLASRNRASAPLKIKGSSLGHLWPHGEPHLDVPTRLLAAGDEMFINDHRVRVWGRAEGVPRFPPRPLIYTTYSNADLWTSTAMCRLAKPSRESWLTVVPRVLLCQLLLTPRLVQKSPRTPVGFTLNQRIGQLVKKFPSASATARGSIICSM